MPTESFQFEILHIVPRIYIYLPESVKFECNFRAGWGEGLAEGRGPEYPEDQPSLVIFPGAAGSCANM